LNSWTNSGANTTYGYDAADEITGVTGSASTTMTYDVAGQVGTLVTTSGGNTTQNYSYSFDSQGNRTQVTDNIAHTSTSVGYDQANQLKSYGNSATYQNDGNGLRASKVVSGTTTNYTWDISGSLPLMILANNTDWIYGPGGVVLEEIVPTNVVYYYHVDQLGSTRKVTDSTGTVVRSYTFDPWGNVSSTSGTLSTPFQFAGQYIDMESGLFYLRARYYDSVTGQFTTVDQFVSKTRSPYGYATNNPVNDADPSGLCGWALWVLMTGTCITEQYTAPRLRGTAIASPLAQAYAAQADAVGQAHDFLAVHAVIGIGACFLFCGSISTQGGHLVGTFGVTGILGRAPYVGYSNNDANHRSKSSVVVGGAYGGEHRSSSAGDCSRTTLWETGSAISFRVLASNRLERNPIRLELRIN
jgi:RHS repeat-associated protein